MAHPDKDTGWAEHPATRQRIRYVLYAICALLAGVDLFVHRHVEIALEKVPAFYALYGFAALVAVVMLAKGLRRLVGRDENYYEGGPDDA